MQDKTQKSALNETLKAEENKVMAKKTQANSKSVKTRPLADKPASITKPIKKAAKPVKNDQPKKPKPLKKAGKKPPKLKIIRDNFSMPESEYNLIAALKKQCLAAKVTVKKNELLTAGLKALSGMSQSNLNKLLSNPVATKKVTAIKVSKGK
jgi:hypothetical protein